MKANGRIGGFKWAVALGLAVMMIGPAWSQADFPSRLIQIVAPANPAGTADLHARALAPALEQILKQPVIVVNKPGVGGALGAQFVASKKADGYTLLLGLSSMSWLPDVDLLYGRAPMYRRDQFVPIALLSADPTVLVTRADSPWKTVAELVADAKSRPEGIRYGSAGAHSTLHLAMEIFSQAAGIRMLHVPYTGGGPAMVALLGGHVDVLAIPPSVALPQVNGGTLRVLAGWGNKRISTFPEAPTLKELGYDAEFHIWAGLFAPSGTPPPILQVLTEATRKAVESPAFKSAMEKIKTPVAYMAPDAFKKHWDEEAEKFQVVVRHIGKVQ